MEHVHFQTKRIGNFEAKVVFSSIHEWEEWKKQQQQQQPETIERRRSIMRDGERLYSCIGTSLGVILVAADS